MGFELIRGWITQNEIKNLQIYVIFLIKINYEFDELKARLNDKVGSDMVQRYVAVKKRKWLKQAK